MFGAERKRPTETYRIDCVNLIYNEIISNNYNKIQHIIDYKINFDGNGQQSTPKLYSTIYSN